jgi:hypothetical protein
MPHRIVITVLPGGKMESRVEGVAGPSCAEKSAWLDRLGRVTEHEPTEAFYEAEAEVEAEAGLGGGGHDDGY